MKTLPPNLSLSAGREEIGSWALSASLVLLKLRAARSACSERERIFTLVEDE